MSFLGFFSKPPTLRASALALFGAGGVAWLAVGSTGPEGEKAGLAVLDSPLTVNATFNYAQSPPDNPLKGLMAFRRHHSAFPHSLYETDVPLSALMTGPDTFDWTALEADLASAVNDGCHLVVRIYMDYPGQPGGIPKFLLDGGLKLTPYPFNGGGTSPDYEDPKLRAALASFIPAFGRKYDGDPRIAFVEAGFLGFWSEWHTSGLPRSAWASLQTQGIVLNALKAAFARTKVLVRYPSGANNSAAGMVQYRNDNLPFGYYDNSFCYDTLGDPVTNSWYFMNLLNAAGPAAVDKWIDFPIGGELYPPLWTTEWLQPGAPRSGQDFSTCVLATHASFIQEGSPLFDNPPAVTNAARLRAVAGAQQLGYEFHVLNASLTRNASSISVGVTITNTGVAPFYYPWPIELAAADPKGNVVAKWATPWVISGILPSGAPNSAAVSLSGTFSLPSPPASGFTLLMRVVNSLPNGKPLRFANTTQDQTLKGWLTLLAAPAADK